MRPTVIPCACGNGFWVLGLGLTNFSNEDGKGYGHVHGGPEVMKHFTREET